MNVLTRLYFLQVCEDVKEKKENHFPRAHYSGLEKTGKPMKPILRAASTHCSEFRINSKCLQMCHSLSYVALSIPISHLVFSAAAEL